MALNLAPCPHLSAGIEGLCHSHLSRNWDVPPKQTADAETVLWSTCRDTWSQVGHCCCLKLSEEVWVSSTLLFVQYQNGGWEAPFGGLWALQSVQSLITLISCTRKAEAGWSWVQASLAHKVNFSMSRAVKSYCAMSFIMSRAVKTSYRGGA